MSEKNSEYYSLSEAYSELMNKSETASSRLGSTAKLIGKSVFNVTKFTFKEILPAVTKEVAKNNIKNNKAIIQDNNSSFEKIKNAHEKIIRAQATLEKIEAIKLKNSTPKE